MKRKSSPPRMTVTVNENGFIVGSQKREPVTRSQAPMQPRPSIPCPICGKSVREDRLNEHRKNAHTIINTDLPTFIKSEQKSQSAPYQVENPSPQTSRSSYEAPELSADSRNATPVPICPHCNTPVHPNNFAKHLNSHRTKLPTPKPTAHATRTPKNEKPKAIRLSRQETRLVRCPECNERMGKSKLQKHRSEKHNIRIRESNRNQSGHAARYSGTKSSRTSAQSQLSRQQLKQSSDEPFDGGKHRSHIERENGRFGSLPLYDDYSEESTP